MAKLGFATNVTFNFTFPIDGQFVVQWNKYRKTLFVHDPAKSSHLTEDGRIYIIDRRYQTAVMQIKNVNFRDAGNYTCSMIPKTSGLSQLQTRYMDVQGMSLRLVQFCLNKKMYFKRPNTKNVTLSSEREPLTNQEYSLDNSIKVYMMKR